VSAIVGQQQLDRVLLRLLVQNEFGAGRRLVLVRKLQVQHLCKRIQTLEKRLHLPELGGNAGQGDTDLGGDDHLLLADSAVLLALLLEQIAVPLLAHFDLGLDLLHLLRVLRLAEQLQILLDLLGILLQDELPLLLDFLLHFQHFLPFFFFFLLLDL